VSFNIYSGRIRRSHQGTVILYDRVIFNDIGDMFFMVKVLMLCLVEI